MSNVFLGGVPAFERRKPYWENILDKKLAEERLEREAGEKAICEQIGMLDRKTESHREILEIVAKSFLNIYAAISFLAASIFFITGALISSIMWVSIILWIIGAGTFILGLYIMIQSMKM